MKFVLASHNRGKLAEMQKILGELGVEVVLQSDLGLALEPEETGDTFAENALIKARAVMEAAACPPSRTTAVCAWTGSTAHPASTPPVTADLPTIRRAIRCCCRICAVLPTARRISTPPSSAASRAGRCCRPTATVTAPSPLPLAARAASATTRFSMCRACARPLPS